METKKLPLTPQDIAGQAKSLMSENNVSPEYLNLFCELYAAEYKTEQKLRLRDLYPQLSRTEIKRRLAEGQTAIDPDRLEVSESALRDLLEKIADILKKHAEGGGALADRLLEAEKDGKLSLRELVRAVVSDNREYIENISKKLGAGGEELVFIMVVLIRPALRRLARSVRAKAELQDISRDRCPACGGAPLMAKIREDDGKRILECSLCGTEWTARRLRCLACGNEDGATLGFLYIEDDACRIDKCDKCCAYIKTVDERRNPEIKTRALPVEDAATLYLDMLAEKKGYHSLR